MNPANADQNNDEQEINLLELLQVVVKRKTIIVRFCVLAAVLSVCYSLTLKNVYTANAKILPPQKESGGGLSALLSQAGSLAGLAAGGIKEMQLATLRNSMTDKSNEVKSFLAGISRLRSPADAEIISKIRASLSMKR